MERFDNLRVFDISEVTNLIGLLFQNSTFTFGGVAEVFGLNHPYGSILVEELGHSEVCGHVRRLRPIP